MLLKLVELRSSDWGRVRDAAAASNATPDNDPNYFMVSTCIFCAAPHMVVFNRTWLVSCLSSIHRMSPRSTQKMELRSRLQIQVEKHVSLAPLERSKMTKLSHLDITPFISWYDKHHCLPHVATKWRHSLICTSAVWRLCGRSSVES